MRQLLLSNEHRVLSKESAKASISAIIQINVPFSSHLASFPSSNRPGGGAFPNKAA